MKKSLLLSLFATFTAALSFSQVAINTDASVANSSAILDVKSTGKGILIPRVALSGTGDITTIPNPATSLMVYNITTTGSGNSAVTPGYYYWEGIWLKMVAQTGGAAPYADFYALMPGDNSSTIPFLAAIEFPRTTVSNSSITSISPTQFRLPDVGTYEVMFQLSITESARVGITLNGSLQFASIVARSTGMSQLIGTTLVTTTSANTMLSVVNAQSSGALTLTSYPGEIFPTSAHLVIKKLY